jgi:hypothetical protein
LGNPTRTDCLPQPAAVRNRLNRHKPFGRQHTLPVQKRSSTSFSSLAQRGEGLAPSPFQRSRADAPSALRDEPRTRNAMRSTRNSKMQQRARKMRCTRRFAPRSAHRCQSEAGAAGLVPGFPPRSRTRMRLPRNAAAPQTHDSCRSAHKSVPLRGRHGWSGPRGRSGDCHGDAFGRRKYCNCSRSFLRSSL